MLGRSTEHIVMVVAVFATVAMITSCSNTSLLTGEAGLTPVPRDGVQRPMNSEFVSLGELLPGEQLDIEISSLTASCALVLWSDSGNDDRSFLAGGGAINQSFVHLCRRAGVYSLLVVDETADGSFPGAALRVLESTADKEGALSESVGDPLSSDPSVERQVVLVEFVEGFLSNPGLFDEQDGTEDELVFLQAIESVVRDGIVDRLRVMFAGTPIEIVTEDDGEIGSVFSRLLYRPDRVLADDQGAFDSAIPPPDPSRPSCAQRVTFGAVTSGGGRVDTGNQVRDDEAVVYVGSFQGRGMACRTAVTDSVNDIIVTLAQTGAHEIGHLVGLLHVGNIDVMNRNATLAFQRELVIGRSQLEVDTPSGPAVLTNIVQDPGLYFELNFGMGIER
jgi:hypothetical protein